MKKNSIYFLILICMLCWLSPVYAANKAVPPMLSLLLAKSGSGIYFFGDVSTISNDEFVTKTSAFIAERAGVEYNSESISAYRTAHGITVLIGKAINDLSYPVTISVYHPDVDHSNPPTVFYTFTLEPNATRYFFDKNYAIGNDWGISGSRTPTSNSQ